MRYLSVVVVALTLGPGTASAQCVGTDSFYTCSDSSGNTYSVSKYGDTTSVTGSNPNGSSWSQNTQSFGGSSYTNGTAADGSAWSSNTTNFASGTMTTGTDSRGNSFSSYCDNFGNCY